MEGSVGEMNWSGAGGTTFWVDPKEDMFVVFMSQTVQHRTRHRVALKIWSTARSRSNRILWNAARCRRCAAFRVACTIAAAR